MGRRSQWALRLVVLAGVVLLSVTTTCRVTLLRPHFASQAVAKVDGFERLYREVLPSPSVQASLRRSLDALPVDPTYVTANLRLAVPPDVLDQVLANLQAQYVAVLTGRQTEVSGVAALQPVVNHLAEVLRALLPGISASAPRLSTRTLAGFSAAFRAWVQQLQAGRLPVALPSVALSPSSARSLAVVLTAGADTAKAPRLRAEVESLLRHGDLTGALATVLPQYLDERALAALLSVAKECAVAVARATPVTASSAGFRLPLGLNTLTALAVAMVLCGGLGLAWRARRATRELGLLVLAGVALSLAAGVVLERVVADPLRHAARSGAVPAVQRTLLQDIDRQLRTDVSHAFLGVLVAIAFVTAIVLLVGRSLRSAPATGRRRLAAGAGTCGVGSTLVALLLLPAQTVGTCNGSQVLCARRYDEASYLTTHNAMASSTRGFVNADQDPDLEGQLDNGVRGLMLDLHSWTTAPELAAFASSLDARTRTAWAPVLRPLEPRPGVWLCHVVCQLGADPAVEQLRGVGRWMREHEDAVVTLILEDHVPEQAVRDTVAAAGLEHLLATPPTHGAPWPTLGSMVRTGHRLVVFTERARPEAGWLRNLYDYAAETPYEARTARDLSCRRGRGPETASLFLLNNWVSTPAPSRLAASQVNARQALARRVATCRAERGMRPTFVAVDFAQTGGALAVVDDLDRLTPD